MKGRFRSGVLSRRIFRPIRKKYLKKGVIWKGRPQNGARDRKEHSDENSVSERSNVMGKVLY